ncbi:cyclic nucleotide-binding protein [Chrysochromulina tobinii]|uniref:Cyclic nucleotide-binding protein n=1 Tax=Chrysochromulina tobinii TaxID=1460289 RepID=A0A0M0JXW5_9EUKA|nr:cyclic nucleotide-binding protein [Chrysochromulina tobinii]|eukprot:KOO30963.1 cyclic nucleotide-binding protein [Chrysochromulina sp. CCMP291]
MTELQNVLLAANVTLSPEGLETLMGNTDSDNDGEISYDEFIDQLQKEFNSGKMGGLVSVVEEASLTYGWLNPMEWFERRRRILRNMDPRQRLRKILNAPKSSRLASVLGLIIVGTIIVSVFTFFLSTVPSLEDSDVLWSIEVACGIIFTIELLLRTYVATLDVRNMMLLAPMYWIDVITIVPFYMDIFSQRDDGLLVLELLELLRLARIFKLLKHYSGWRVLLIAIENSWRALMVPGFAMLIVTLLLSGALIILERADAHTARRNQTSPGALEPEQIADGFEAMWIVFWVVATLGYDGSYGLEGPAQRVIFAFAIVCGLLFTTMPITVIGEAFRSAWERKEVIELQMQIAIMLEERGLTMSQLHRVFREFDTSGDGQLDWGEFKRAMKTMRLNVPVFKLRQLFALFDEDETGEVDYHEFCRILFPNLDQDTIAADSAADKSGECSGNQSRGGRIGQWQPPP